MSFLVKIAKCIGFSVIAIILLAIPSLFVLSVVFHWGFFTVLALGFLYGIEIFATVCILGYLSEVW